MLYRIPHAFRAAIQAFHATLSMPPVRYNHPVWDNGIDYNIPTFLRRTLKS